MESLEKAFKSFQLYPRDHDACRRSLAIAKSRLDALLNERSTLKLYVEKDRFLSGGEAIHSAASQEGMSALLYRDGVFWLEFRKGVLLEEIDSFLQILIKYRHLEAESDGDVVTALWEKKFRHILYDAKEVFWEEDPLVGFSLPHLSDSGTFPAPEKQATDETAPAAEEALVEEVSGTPFTPIVTEGKAEVWDLAPPEEQMLKEMVFEQENLENMDAATEILVLVLRDKSLTGSKKHEDIGVILEFLAKTLQDTFHQEAFSTGLKLLKRLDEVRTLYKAEAPRSVRLINNFFIDISSPDFLNSLSALWPKLASLDSRRIRSVEEVLLLLHPRAITALLPMIDSVSSETIRQLLFKIVVSLTRRDMTPLEKLAVASDETTALQALRVLDAADCERGPKLLLKLAGHPSFRVRKESIHLMIQKNPEEIQRIFPLIEDEDESMRRMIFGILGKRRDRLTEQLLIDHLRHRRFKQTDPNHLLACYQTLGLCGSDLSIPFLKQTLFGGRFSFFAGFDRRTERQGAALALLSLEGDGAKRILEAAGRSMVPGIRIAVNRAMERYHGR